VVLRVTDGISKEARRCEVRLTLPQLVPDSFGASGIALDSGGVLAIGIGAATDFFCAAKAAEGASPRTVEWYRMILIRAVRRFGDPRPVDAITAAELRTWLLEPRSTLAPSRSPATFAA
jgi:hypothetical protein